MSHRTSRTALDRYLRDLTHERVLSREEELALTTEYARTRRPEVAHELARGHLRLVVKIAREYLWCQQELADLVEEGNVGLLIAIGKFDPERGVRLSSYAAWWIRALIMRFIVENRRLVRIGTTADQRRVMQRLRKERERLEKSGQPADVAALAAALGVPVEGLAALAQHVDTAEVALDAPSFAGAEGTRLDHLADAASASPEELALAAELRGSLCASLDDFERTLPARERRLLARWRSDEPPTLSAIGVDFGVSRERMRQLEKRMLDRLARFLRGRLGDAVEVAPRAA